MTPKVALSKSRDLSGLPPFTPDTAASPNLHSVLSRLPVSMCSSLAFALMWLWGFSAQLTAENIHLGDGRLLVDASVMSESGSDVVLRHADGLVSVAKKLLPENLRARYPVFEDQPAAATAPAPAAPRKKSSVAPGTPSGPKKSDPEPSTLSPESEKRTVIAAAESLAKNYFETKHRTIGGFVEVSLNLEAPEPVTGWSGRWRIHGFANLRHYRDPAANPRLAERIRSLSENPELSAKQFKRIIERETFIRSEVVDFEAEVSDLHTTPSISVSILLRSSSQSN